MSRTAQIILIGSAGRVGKEIVDYLRTEKAAKIYSRVDHKGRGDAVSIEKIKPVKNVVVIDFSTAKSFREALNWAVENKVPIVSGTTGLCEDDFSAMVSAAKTIPVLWSSNMSRGVSLFLEFISKFGEQLADYDLAIDEVHHKKKKDAPSGTAKTIHNVLSKATNKKCPKPNSIRGGGVFGIHRLWIMGKEETMVFEHTALNRRVFARGALTAALWLKKQKSGLYAMRDTLN